MNQGNNVEVSHNGNPLECRGGGGRGGGLLRREVYRGEEAVRRSEAGPALCLCGGTDGGEEDFFPNLKSTTDLRDFCQVNLWQNGGVESYSEDTLAPIFSRFSRSKIKKFFMRARTCSQWKVS